MYIPGNYGDFMKRIQFNRENKDCKEPIDIDLCLWLSGDSGSVSERIQKYSGVLREMTIAIPERVGVPERAPDHIRWITYSDQTSKTKVWNQFLLESRSNCQLILEEDEEISLESIRLLENLNEGDWGAALITCREGDRLMSYYQVRYFQQVTEPVFRGELFPDVTQYVTQHDIRILDQPIQLKRKFKVYQASRIEREMQLPAISPFVYLAYAEWLMQERHYSEAGAYYRKLLGYEKLLPFDRLAAVNGLAACHTEKFKWEQALQLVKQSLEAEPLQKLPYLVQFRIYELKKEWEKAKDTLETYYSQQSFATRANFDKSLSEEETLEKLGELALQCRKHDEAGRYFEELYRLREGEVDRSFLKRLFVMAAERGDYPKTIFYFEELFSAYLPDKLSRRANLELHDCMEQFIQNQWYDYALKVYEDLVREDPTNSDFKRRFIVLLSKLNQMDRAREVIAGGI